MKEDDLYVTDFAYGDACSKPGFVLDGRTQLNQWMADKNKDALVNWLKSANLEKQVYAIEGLLRLQAKDVITLSSEEQKIIAYVKSKQGSITACKDESGTNNYFIPDVINWMENRIEK